MAGAARHCWRASPTGGTPVPLRPRRWLQDARQALSPNPLRLSSSLTRSLSCGLFNAGCFLRSRAGLRPAPQLLHALSVAARRQHSFPSLPPPCPIGCVLPTDWAYVRGVGQTGSPWEQWGGWARDILGQWARVGEDIVTGDDQQPAAGTAGGTPAGGAPAVGGAHPGGGGATGSAATSPWVWVAVAGAVGVTIWAMSRR